MSQNSSLSQPAFTAGAMTRKEKKLLKKQKAQMGKPAEEGNGKLEEVSLSSYASVSPVITKSDVRPWLKLKRSILLPQYCTRALPCKDWRLMHIPHMLGCEFPWNFMGCSCKVFKAGSKVIAVLSWLVYVYWTWCGFQVREGMGSASKAMLQERARLDARTQQVKQHIAHLPSSNEERRNAKHMKRPLSK